jgi:hypothetical protein
MMDMMKQHDHEHNIGNIDKQENPELKRIIFLFLPFLYIGTGILAGIIAAIIARSVIASQQIFFPSVHIFPTTNKPTDK